MDLGPMTEFGVTRERTRQHERWDKMTLGGVQRRPWPIEPKILATPSNEQIIAKSSGSKNAASQNISLLNSVYGRVGRLTTTFIPGDGLLIGCGRTAYILPWINAVDSQSAKTRAINPALYDGVSIVRGGIAVGSTAGCNTLWKRPSFPQARARTIFRSALRYQQSSIFRGGTATGSASGGEPGALRGAIVSQVVPNYPTPGRQRIRIPQNGDSSTTINLH